MRFLPCSGSASVDVHTQVDPVPTEYYLESLKEIAPLEAAKRLLHISRQSAAGKYKSPEVKSGFQLLADWLDIAIASPDEVGLELEGMPPAHVNGATAGPSSGEESKYIPPEADVDLSSDAKLDVERIIRKEGLEIYKDQAGRLWAGLAQFWIKKGDIEHVR